MFCQGGPLGINKQSDSSAFAFTRIMLMSLTLSVIEQMFECKKETQAAVKDKHKWETQKQN